MTTRRWELTPDQITAGPGRTAPAASSALGGLAGGAGNQAFARMVAPGPGPTLARQAGEERFHRGKIHRLPDGSTVSAQGGKIYRIDPSGQKQRIEGLKTKIEHPDGSKTVIDPWGKISTTNRRGEPIDTETADQPGSDAGESGGAGPIDGSVAGPAGGAWDDATNRLDAGDPGAPEMPTDAGDGEYGAPDLPMHPGDGEYGGPELPMDPGENGGGDDIGQSLGESAGNVW